MLKGFLLYVRMHRIMQPFWLNIHSYKDHKGVICPRISTNTVDDHEVSVSSPMQCFVYISFRKLSQQRGRRMGGEAELRGMCVSIHASRGTEPQVS